MPISGKGPFDFKLKKDGQPLPEGVKFKVNECDGIITLTVPNVSTDDEGKYDLIVANDAGSLAVPFKLKVKAPPGPPQGPMDITDIGKNNCTLHWKSPAQDNGSRVTHYCVEKRDCSKGKDAWVPYADNIKEHFIDVHGLKENGEYEFRVMAVNQNGVSQPLTSDHSIVAKLGFGVPDAPGVPAVQEIGSDFVSLHWTKPLSDGGGPIQGYYVEKKEKDSDKWHRCNYTPTSITQYNIHNLIEDKDYEFRVIAENEAGCSEPSQNSRSVLVRDPNATTSPEFMMRLEDCSANEGKTAYFECDINASPNTDVRFFKSGREIFNGGKYQITQDGTKYTLAVQNVSQDDEDEYSVKAKNKGGSKMSRASLTVRSAPKIRVPVRFQQPSLFEKDEPISIKLPFTANPQPTAKWFKDGEEIRSGSMSYSTEISSHSVTLKFRSPTSTSQSGMYKLVLENPLGSDSCEVSIQIADVPTAPRFLVCESVRDESVSLSWKVPNSDGGSHITGYIIERLDLSDESPVWKRVSRTRGLHFTDEFLMSQQKYQYRIMAENSQGK